MINEPIIISELECPICKDKMELKRCYFQRQEQPIRILGRIPTFNYFEMKCQCGCKIEYDGERKLTTTEKDWYPDD